MPRIVRLILVDDHAMVRTGLRAILEREADFAVIGETGSGAEALALAMRLHPDVAVADLNLRDMDGLELLERLATRCPQVKVLVTPHVHHGSYLRRAIQAGAAGYLPKRHGAADLVRAVRLVAWGGGLFAVDEDGPYGLTADYGRLALLSPPHSTLTEREREVLHLVALGFSNSAIAVQLHISPKTVDSHRTHLMDKLGLHSRADLTHYALTQGYLVAS